MTLPSDKKVINRQKLISVKILILLHESIDPVPSTTYHVYVNGVIFCGSLKHKFKNYMVRIGPQGLQCHYKIR